ncbi:MAG: hypothetical protein NTW86_07470 [Candidatus Sumerlaeota bacterium]|nr:hypothetical protein [Candidatus Sumerlaeota bacterium]
MTRASLAFMAMCAAFASATLSGCATVKGAKNAPAAAAPEQGTAVGTEKPKEAGQDVSIKEMAERKMGALEMRQDAPGWMRVSIQAAPGAKPFRAILPGGRVVRAETNAGRAYLTLAGAAIPVGGKTKAEVLVPVAALFAQPGEAGESVQPSGAHDRFAFDDSLERYELHQIAATVSSPDCPWRIQEPEAVAMPREGRRLKPSVFAGDAAQFDRARRFFGERAPIQTALWMLLFNFDKKELGRQLAVDGPGLEPLAGAERDRALESTAANAFALWTSMGLSPDGSKLAADYPKLASRAKADAKAGSKAGTAALPLAPVAVEQAGDAKFLKEAGLVVAADYE